MHTPLKFTLVLSGLILVGAGCARYSAPYASPASGPEATAPVYPAASATRTSPGEVIVEYTNGVFNPSNTKILPGEKVTFVNKGSKEVWPASGAHPTHQICPGFDALKGLKQGERYSFVFTEAKDCPFHNHLAPSEKGKIEVRAQ